MQPLPTLAGSEPDADLALDATLAPDADAALDDAAIEPDAGESDSGVLPVEPDATTSLPDTGAPDSGPIGAPVCNPATAPVVGKLGLEAVVSSSSLSGLTEATQPPDSNDWYLVEQRGRVMIFRDGALLPDPFIDLTQ